MSLSARLAVTLVITWLLLSGLFKAQLLLLGALSIGAVVWLSIRMRVLEHRGQPLYFKLGALARYWFWLLAEIMRSNIDVCRRVLDPSLPIRPALRAVSATADSELGDVIYANSITLTPGTTAISFTPSGDVLVHALDAESLDDLEAGGMVDHVKRVEPSIVARGDEGDVTSGAGR